MIKINVKSVVAVPSWEADERTKTLNIGVNTIDESILGHWFVQSLIKNGTISIITKKQAKEFSKPKAEEEKTIFEKIVDDEVIDDVDDVVIAPQQTIRIETSPNMQVGKVVFNDKTKEEPIPQEAPKTKIVSKRKKKG